MGKREILKALNEQLLDYFTKFDDPESLEIQESIRKRQENLYKIPDGVNKFLITISFDDSKIRLETIAQDITRRLARAWVAGYTFSIEQRGEKPDDYHGIHTHILVYTKVQAKSVVHIKREVSSWFKALINGPQYVDVKKVDNNSENRVLKYISGIKQDPDKDAKVANDQLFRMKYHLDALYHKVVQ